MPFAQGDPSFMASVRAFAASSLWLFCASAGPVLTIAYLLYRFLVSPTPLPTTTSRHIDETLVEYVTFFVLERYPDVICLALLWILHLVSNFVIFRTHMNGGNRSYSFSRSQFVRSIFVDYFKHDVHFDTKITRAWVEEEKKNKTTGNKKNKINNNNNSKTDAKPSNGVNYDPEGGEAIRQAIEWFPTSTATRHQKYIVGNHPHGYLGFSTWSTWAAIGETTDKVFYKRGIDHISLHTFDMNFLLPFWDTLITKMGLCSVSREGIGKALANKNRNKSKSTADKTVYSTNIANIVPGGAPESLTSAVRHDLILKDKGGFIKVALEEDAMLVPTFHFGDERAFKQVFPDGFFGPKETTDSVAPWFIKKLLDVTSIGFPLVRGKYWFPMLPFQTKMDAVIGEPMNPRKMVRDHFGGHDEDEVDDGAGENETKKMNGESKNQNKKKQHHKKFTREEVAYVHAEYVKRIEELHARYAPLFSPEQKLRLL